MSRYRAVAVGCSAGGVRALSILLSQLPGDFPLPLLVVQHMAPGGGVLLVEGLNRVSPLRVGEAEEKEAVRPGRVYTAPPDYHLLVEKTGRLSLSIDEKVLHSRPSIDILFETAAEAFGKTLIGVLMTGANTDGCNGLLRIRAAGGMTIVEDPDRAEVDIMPRSAVEAGAARCVVPVEGIAARLVSLVMGEP